MCNGYIVDETRRMNVFIYPSGSYSNQFLGANTPSQPSLNDTNARTPPPLVCFEEKSPFSSGREQSEQEVSVATIVLYLLCVMLLMLSLVRGKYQRLLDSINSYV